MNQLSGVKKKDELIFIQKTLKKITNQDLDIEYIEKNYLKILFKCLKLLNIFNFLFVLIFLNFR